MKLINRALKLSPDTSEDAAVSGMESLHTELATANKKLAQSEADLKTANDTLANRD
ncbi:MAG: hypothetical protein ACK5NG_10770 [Chthoniobacterales bacterium]